MFSKILKRRRWQLPKHLLRWQRRKRLLLWQYHLTQILMATPKTSKNRNMPLSPTPRHLKSLKMGGWETFFECADTGSVDSPQSSQTYSMYLQGSTPRQATLVPVSSTQQNVGHNFKWIPNPPQHQPYPSASSVPADIEYIVQSNESEYNSNNVTISSFMLNDAIAEAMAKGANSPMEMPYDMRKYIVSFVETSKIQLEVFRKQQEEFGTILLQMKGYMEKLAESVKQLNAKMDTIGTAKENIIVKNLQGDSVPFTPVNNEAELIQINELAKDEAFSSKVPKIRKDGQSVGLSIIDNFGTREFWTLCSYTSGAGAGKGDMDQAIMKINISKYVNFMSLISCTIRICFPNWQADDTKSFLSKAIMNNAKVRLVRDKKVRAAMSRASAHTKKDELSEEENNN